MAPSELPAIFNPTQQDIEMLLSAQCHLGSKNLQVHMEPYLYKTRPDGINVINIGKTWYVVRRYSLLAEPADICDLGPSARLPEGNRMRRAPRRSENLNFS